MTDLADAFSSPHGLAVHVSDGAWRPAEHLVYIGERLKKLAGRWESAPKNLMIFCPPQHGKSELVSRYFPAWYLGMNPDHVVMLLSYEAGFAKHWGGMARDVFRTAGPEVFNLELAEGNKAPRAGWRVAGRRGQFNCSGAGGPITGKPVDLLIVDDPVKDHGDAMSRARQEYLWNWWRSTVGSRIVPRTRIVLIMTRWHEYDIAGRILEHDADSWEVITLPALAVEDDILGREEGEPLWPEMRPLEFLQDQREKNGTYWFGAMYQQRPQGAEGAIFHRSRFRYFRDEGSHFALITASGVRRVLKADCYWYQTGDFAHRVRSQNDYTAIATLAITPDGEMLVVDMVRERLEVSQQWPRMKQLRAAFPLVAYQAVEAADAGFGVIAAAASEGHALRELKADRDKITRATGVSVAYEAGRVYHLDGAPWLGDFEAELLYFPAGRHDDQVDVLAYGWIEQMSRPPAPAMCSGPAPEDEPAAGRARKSSSSGASYSQLERRNRPRGRFGPGFRL